MANLTNQKAAEFMQEYKDDGVALLERSLLEVGRQGVEQVNRSLLHNVASIIEIPGERHLDITATNFTLGNVLDSLLTLANAEPPDLNAMKLATTIMARIKDQIISGTPSNQTSQGSEDLLSNASPGEPLNVYKFIQENVTNGALEKDPYSLKPNEDDRWAGHNDRQLERRKGFMIIANPKQEINQDNTPDTGDTPGQKWIKLLKNLTNERG